MWWGNYMPGSGGPGFGPDMYGGGNSTLTSMPGTLPDTSNWQTWDGRPYQPRPESPQGPQNAAQAWGGGQWGNIPNAADAYAQYGPQGGAPPQPQSLTDAFPSLNVNDMLASMGKPGGPSGGPMGPSIRLDNGLTSRDLRPQGPYTAMPQPGMVMPDGSVQNPYENGTWQLPDRFRGDSQQGAAGFGDRFGTGGRDPNMSYDQRYQQNQLALMDPNLPDWKRKNLMANNERLQGMMGQGGGPQAVVPRPGQVPGNVSAEATYWGNQQPSGGYQGQGGWNNSYRQQGAAGQAGMTNRQFVQTLRPSRNSGGTERIMGLGNRQPPQTPGRIPTGPTGPQSQAPAGVMTGTNQTPPIKPKPKTNM